jgi:hypothetical protein
MRKLCLYVGNTDASFKYWFCFLLGPIWYLENFVCLNFNPQCLLYIYMCIYIVLYLNLKMKRLCSIIDFIIFSSRI